MFGLVYVKYLGTRLFFKVPVLVVVEAQLEQEVEEEELIHFHYSVLHLSMCIHPS
nr:MAG TPA: hypothetical protein [Caudoviricetes sp.]